jgi:hypothetical protein
MMVYLMHDYQIGNQIQGGQNCSNRRGTYKQQFSQMKFNIKINRIIFYLQNKENNVQNSVSTHFNRRMCQACQYKGGYSWARITTKE